MYIHVHRYHPVTDTHIVYIDLKSENAVLHEENKSLKAYMEQLLLNIMDSRPDILEVGKFQSPHSTSGIVQ